MRSLTKLRKRLTTQCRRAKSEIFLDAPNWVIATTIGLLPCGVLIAALFGSAPSNPEPPILAQLVAGSMIVLGLVLVIKILRHRHLLFLAPRSSIELSHFGKTVGKLSGTEVSDIYLERMRNSDTWRDDLITASGRLKSCLIMVVSLTLKICVILLAYNYVFDGASVEKVFAASTIRYALGLSFNLSVWGAFCWLLIVLLRERVLMDEGLHRDLLTAAGLVGVNPYEIVFRTGIIQKVKTPTVDHPA